MIKTLSVVLPVVQQAEEHQVLCIVRQPGAVKLPAGQQVSETVLRREREKTLDALSVFPAQNDLNVMEAGS